MEDSVPILAAWRTDPGLVRGHNEDFVAAFEPEKDSDREHNGWLYLVADGVGGADAGEVASEYASERTRYHYLAAVDRRDWGKRLVDAMQMANTDLRRLAAQRSDSRRMATTMVALVVQDGWAYIGNVGDSRAYRWREGVLAQMTRDQSLVAQLLQEGAITAEEAATYPYKNIILSSLGSERKPPIDLYQVPLQPGDQLVLCSDGLTRHIEDAEISRLLSQASPDEAVDTLVELARERGGEDNITVAIIRYGEVPEIPIPEALVASATAVAAVQAETAVTLVEDEPEPVVAVAAESRGYWSCTILLGAIMVALILLLWWVIQQTMVV